MRMCVFNEWKVHILEDNDLILRSTALFSVPHLAAPTVKNLFPMGAKSFL